MQPNDPQGYNQPPAQPVRPAMPPQPVVSQPVPSQPVAPVQQPAPIAPTPGLAPVVNQAALQAALSEPGLPTAQQSLGPIGTDSDEGNDASAEQATDEAPVSWVAHEYIHHEKGALWFFLFVVVLLALLAVSIFLMNSWSFAVLLVVIAIVVVVYSRRPPRELSYSLTDEGLMIDQTLHKFSDFKSFGVIRDGEDFSVMLIPTRRFQPGVTVYFPEDAGEAIVDMLGARLPMKDLRLDAVDRVVRLLRL